MARAVFGGGLSPYITKAQDRPTPYNPLGALSTAIRQPFVEDVIVPGISRIRDEMRISEQEGQISAQAQERRDAARSAMGKAFFREAQAKMPEVPTMPSLASLSDSAATQANDHYIDSLSRELEDMVAQGMPSGALRQKVALMAEVGLGDVAREILQGATAQESLRAAQVAKLKSQLRQQIAAPAPEAVAGPQMLQPSMKGERLLLKNEGQYENPLQRKVDLLARRAYERTEGSREQKLAAAMAAAQAAQPEAIAAQEVQAVERPELLEEAAAFREQATALEAEAKGIEETPVYREFGDYAMAFLEALETGDVAKQNALMASVGGSTDYQPAGKGAMGEAMSKDASMRARRDLLELKKDWLKAQRREKTGLKFINARKKKTTAKTGRAIARSGMGADEFDKLFKTNEFDKKIGTRQDRTIEYDGQTIDITYGSDPSGALQQLHNLSRYVRGKNAKRELKSRLGGIGTRISGTGEGTAATTKKTEETEEQRESKKTAADKKEAKKRSVAIDKEVFGLRGDLVDIAADLSDARTERDKFDKEDLDDMTNQPAQAAAAAVRFLTAEQGRLMARVKVLEAEKKALSAEEGSLSTGRTTAGGNVVTETKTQ